MNEALILTVMGMSVVYVVLALIYGAIVLLGITNRFWPQEAPAATTDLAPVTAGPSADEEAAIVAALSQHLNRSPNTFSVRIREEK